MTVPALLKAPLSIALSLAVAFALGVWSVLAALDAAGGLSAIRIGPWEAFPLAQTAKADPYARARRARDGRLLYASAEGLSFTARQDGAGAPLDAACRYRLSGLAPAARFWTLYVLPEGGRPATDDARPTALNSRTILRQPDGAFAISAATSAEAGNWLALPAAGRFALVLTLFDTPVASSTGLADIPMPLVEKAGCGHG